MQKYSTHRENLAWQPDGFQPNESTRVAYMASEVDARIAELEKYKTAVEAHNAECQSMCGVGDQEAVKCGYRPYFVGSHRRCSSCPVYMKIDL